jgi:hypothetical protein
MPPPPMTIRQATAMAVFIESGTLNFCANARGRKWYPCTKEREGRAIALFQ